MKYIKSFELFESQQIFEDEFQQIFNSEITVDIQNKLKSLTPDEKEKLKSELKAFASKFDLSIKDLRNPYKVAKALAKNKDIIKILNESELTIGEEKLFEGLWEKYKIWFQKKKTKIGEWISKFAGLTILGGIIIMSMSGKLNELTKILSIGYQTMDPNSSVVVGWISYIISIIIFSIDNDNDNDHLSLA